MGYILSPARRAEFIGELLTQDTSSPYPYTVKSISADLPEKIAEELSRLVETGWLRDEGEAVRIALVEFLGHRAAEIQERFQHGDIEWALRKTHKAVCAFQTLRFLI